MVQIYIYIYTNLPQMSYDAEKEGSQGEERLLIERIHANVLLGAMGHLGHLRFCLTFHFLWDPIVSPYIYVISP